MDKPRCSTAAVVMNNSAIYLMPGNPLGMNAPTPSVCSIFTLDLKNANKYDKNDINFVKVLAMEKWQSIMVQESPHWRR